MLLFTFIGVIYGNRNYRTVCRMQSPRTFSRSWSLRTRTRTWDLRKTTCKSVLDENNTGWLHYLVCHITSNHVLCDFQHILSLFASKGNFFFNLRRCKPGNNKHVLLVAKFTRKTDETGRNLKGFDKSWNELSQDFH